jgi:pimeloyl-ACP methyl ester carboxylesterase
MTGIMAEITGFAHIHGVDLAYRMSGAGQTIVLIHAGICDQRMWKRQAVAFSADHRVLRYDCRGFGQSGHAPGPFSHAADLAALLERLEIDSAVLLGMSMGGEVAIQTALTIPDKVRGLVVAASLAGIEEPGPDLRLLWDETEYAYEAGDLQTAIELELRGWVDGPYRDPGQVDGEVRELVRQMNTAIWERTARQADAEEAAFDPPVAQRLDEIAVPTLLIGGELDQRSVLKSMNWLAAGIAGAESAVIEGAAHLPNMDAPDRFNRLVLDFLARHRL